jgi:F-type H+-transporting ATPase subunit epsilon
MSHFKVDILTPSCVVAKNLGASSVLVPTERGEINLLPQHTHLMAKLDIGVLRLEDNGGKDRLFFISKGVCKVLKDRITILTASGEANTDIDLSRAQKSFEECKLRLESGDIFQEGEREKLEEKYRRAVTRLEMKKK